MSNSANIFSVDVIYALPHQQKVITINVTEGTTFIDALKQSQMIAFFPEIKKETVKLGTFGRLVKHDDILESGQRVEIYRPLIADPKDVRRRRAEKAKLEAKKSS